MANKLTALEEARARLFPPPAHADDAIIEVGKFLVWRKRADVDGTEPVFFDVDYRDVLEPDDPRLKGLL